uniref:Amino acid adenylation domain-containing protein n=1 Tax=Candidatus Kentrum sp. FW TaxID=2126338 RepID=A0A450TFY1_9GAMM|nr:MAG: amino acid adenylation domain-containing protein [Candidatus Kentron sp. FW]
MDGELTGRLEYATDLFERPTMERLVGHLQILLAGIVADPQTPIHGLPLLTEAERQQLLAWNNTTVDYPTDKTIVDLFEEQVERTPEAIAVVFEDRQLTYRELNAEANRLGHYLQKLGVGPEVLVGICIERSLEMVVGLLGILKAGGAYVPLDPAYPMERLAFMMEDADVPVLLTQSDLKGKLPETKARVVYLDTGAEALSESSSGNVISAVGPENLAYVIYTSGSTGRPKGVMVPHRALYNHTRWMQTDFPLDNQDKVLQKTPISFDASVWEFYAPLVAGARLVLARPDWQKDLTSLIGTITRHQITILQMVPSLLQAITSLPEMSTVTSLKRIFCGGEKLSRTLMVRTLDIPGAELVNLYGPTEACIDATFWRCSPEHATVPIGKPVANSKTYILDAHLQPLSIGVPGELHIGGAGLARGYLNRPELTAEKFIPDPFDSEPGARLYKTGDLCRWLPDGTIEYLGRMDHQVKIRGFRIELGEVENALLSHPDVHEAVVDTRGEGMDKKLVAWLVGTDDVVGATDVGATDVGATDVGATDVGATDVGATDVGATDVGATDVGATDVGATDVGATCRSPLRDAPRAHLCGMLPDWMVPSVFVFVDTLPMTPNGKVDRRALAERSIKALQRPDKGFVAPRTPEEESLAAIWAEVLGIDRVGIHDNFFDLGGHSLLAIGLFSRIEKQFGRHLPLSALFQGATVAELATRLAATTDTMGKSTDPWQPLVAIQTGGVWPPFFCLPGAGGNVLYFQRLAHALGEERPFYGLQAVGLDGESEPDTTVEAMAARYIREIRTVQPQGPYLLGGHSFGGWVGLEMSKQLREQGEQVARLAIFDTTVPSGQSIGADWEEADWIVEIAHIAERLLGIALEISDSELRRMDTDEQLGYLHGLLGQNGWELSVKQLQALVRIFRANCQMDYVPRDISPIPISLFKAREPASVTRTGIQMEAFSQPLKADPTWGWGQYAAGTVELHEVPGNHYTMMNGSNAQVLAERLRGCLDIGGNRGRDSGFAGPLFPASG